MSSEPYYVLEPTSFFCLREAEDLTRKLEEALQPRGLATADVRDELFALFAEVVANATEHGKSGYGASAHIRYMPHRRGFAFDSVVTDRGPGIRATLGNNQTLTQFASDTDAIKAAVQMSVSGTGAPEGPRPLEGSHRDAEAKQSTLDPLRGYPAPDPRGRRDPCLGDGATGRHHGENGHPRVSRGPPVASPENVTEILALISRTNQD